MSALSPPSAPMPTSPQARPAWTRGADQPASAQVGEGAGGRGAGCGAWRAWCVGGLLSITSTSCTLQDPTHWLAPDGAASYVIIQVGGAGIAVEAQGGPLGRGYSAEDLRQLYVLGYTEDLTQLGLEPGLLRVEAGGGALPEPRWIQTIDWTAEPPGNFRQLSELPRAIAELRFAAIDPCPTLVPEVVPLGEAGLYFFFFVGVDPDRALLGTNRGLFLVEPGVARRVVPPGAEGRVYTAAWAPAPDDLWLARSDGVIERGNLQDGLQVVTRAPRALQFGALSGGLTPEGPELYGATSSTSVVWWRRGEWRTLAVTLDPSARTSVAPLSDGGFVVGRRSASTVLQIQGEVPYAEVVDLGLSGSDQIRSLQLLEGFGAVIGTQLGDLYARQSGHWSRVAGLDTPVAITVAASAFGGLFLGGENVVFGLRFGEERGCPSTGYSIGGNHHVKHAVRIGDDVYLSQEVVNQEGSFLLRVHRR